MSSYLLDNVALVTSTDSTNKGFGTAFSIYADDVHVYMLTCYHVINHVGGRERILVDDREAELVAGSEDVDIAVVKVSAHRTAPILRLTSRHDRGGVFSTVGYQKVKNQFMTIPVSGRIEKKVGIRGKRASSKTKAWRLSIEDEDIVDAGYSGSPVVNRSGEKVFAVLSHSVKNGEQAMAISVECLPIIWPTMPRIISDDLEESSSIRRICQQEPLLGRQEETQAFEAICTGNDRTNKAILIDGPSGIGKTYLMKEYDYIAKKNNFETLWIHLARHFLAEELVAHIAANLGLRHFQGYNEFRMNGKPVPLTRGKENEWHRQLTMKFFSDLERLPGVSRLAIMFDQFEKADRVLSAWLDQVFLPGIASNDKIIAVVAGHNKLDMARKISGTRCLKLSGLSRKDFEDYAKFRGVELSTEQISDFHQMLHGAPKLYADFVNAKAKRSKDA